VSQPRKQENDDGREIEQATPRAGRSPGGFRRCGPDRAQCDSRLAMQRAYRFSVMKVGATGVKPDHSSCRGSCQRACAAHPGLPKASPALSWNSSHPSRGCAQEALASTGGAGLLYCFAAK